MTPADENGREPGGDDMLAAEYVLGVLPADERRLAARRIETDAAFAQLVDRWEAQLSPLASAYEEVEPPGAVKDALDRRLLADRVPAATKPGLWHSLPFWRGLATASIVALAVYVGITMLQPPVDEAEAVRFVASLAAEDSDVRYVAVYDAERHRVGLSHLSGVRTSGRDFELWMIESGNPPVSLGVIPVGDTVHLVLPKEAYEKLRQGAVFAISLEPAGGSPTGQPTGPVVATGEVRQL